MFKLKNIKLLFTLILLSFTAYGNEKVINISINNISEEKGLELGDNSQARGTGSISTGRNAIALGLNAVATGGDENKESIEVKLIENRENLGKIEKAKKLINEKTNELARKQIRERNTIEAGIRVEEIRKAKEKAKNKWETSINLYNSEKLASENFLKEQMLKVDNLNSRLTGLSKIPSINISSEEGLRNAAIELKKIAEEETNLNLSIDFYKDYVNSYYKALGDLRKNYQSYEYFTRDSDYGENSDIFNVLDKSILKRQKDEVNGYYMEDYGIEALKGLGTISTGETFGGKDNKCLNFNGTYEQTYFSNLNKNEIFSTSIFYKESEVITDTQFTNWNANKDSAKEKYIDYASNIGNGLFNLVDIPNSEEYITYIYNKKFELADLSQKAKYYQWEYERTKDTIWLDKKKEALDKYNKILSKYDSENREEVRKIFSSVEGYSDGNTLMDIMKNNILAWKKNNITDIKDKNKITVATLTAELEEALGINKNAILEKENELNELKKKVEQDKANYEAINPSESDLILAREYVRVKKEIEELSNEIIQAEEELRNFQGNLTLHNLTNIGKDQIAIGTSSLAVKNNAIAIGTKTISIGEDTISLGKENLVVGDKSFALGNNNIIYGENNIVIGNQNRIGKNNQKENNVYILGGNIVVNEVSDAIVLGNNSIAVENALSIGNSENLRKIVNVADGEISNISNEVITGKQLKNAIDNITIPEIDLSNFYTKNETNELLDTKIDKDKFSKDKNEEMNRVIDKANLSKALNDEIESKANKDGGNIQNKDKIKFRENIEVYSKLEIDDKLSNIEINANGKITENDENAVKGKTIYKYLTNNYIVKQELNTRDEAINNNYKQIQENKKAIILNTEKIRQVEKKVNRTAALSSAMSAIEFSRINTGEVSIGAGISSFSGEQGIAIGLLYSPMDNLLLGLKYAGLTDNRYNGAIGGTVSYKFRLHN